MAQHTLRRSFRPPAQSVFADEAIDFTALAYFYRDENDLAAPPQRLAVQQVPHRAVPFLDEGVDTTQLKYFEKDEHDVWGRPGNPYTQAQPWQAVTFAEREGVDTTQLAYFYWDEADVLVQFPRQAVPWAAVPFRDDDAVSVTPTATGDEDYFVLPPAQLTPRSLFVALDEGEGAGFQFFSLEQEEPTVLPAPTQARPWVAIAFIEEGDAFPVTFDQEDFALPAVQPRPWLPVVVTDDEAAPLLPVEEEYWTRPPTEVTPTSTFVRLDEGELGGFAYFFLEQEEFLLPAVTALPRPAPAATDDEASSFAYQDQEESFLPPTEARPWLAVLFADEHAAEPLAYFYLEDEQPAYPAVTAGPWAARVFLDDDLYPTPPPTTAVEQEDGYPLTQQARPWLPRPALDEGVDAAALAYLPVDQDDWRAPAALPGGWLARVFADDEAGRPVVEDDAPWAPAVVAAYRFPTGQPADDEARASAGLDEDGAPVLARQPGWATARLLAPADDDRPTPPVPLFVDDEAGPFSTSSFAASVRPWLRFAVEDEHGLGFIGTGLGNTGVVIGGARRRQVIVARG